MEFIDERFAEGEHIITKDYLSQAIIECTKK